MPNRRDFSRFKRRPRDSFNAIGITPLATSVPPLTGLQFFSPDRDDTTVARGVSPWWRANDLWAKIGYEKGGSRRHSFHPCREVNLSPRGGFLPVVGFFGAPTQFLGTFPFTGRHYGSSIEYWNSIVGRTLPLSITRRADRFGAANASAKIFECEEVRYRLLRV